MADQKTATTVLKKTELERSLHRKMRKIAEKATQLESEDCSEGYRDCESVDC